jgi:hypothetical protein
MSTTRKTLISGAGEGRARGRLRGNRRHFGSRMNMWAKEGGRFGTAVNATAQCFGDLPGWTGVPDGA